VTKIQHTFELTGGLGNQLFQISAARELVGEPLFDVSMLRKPFLAHPVDLDGLISPDQVIDSASNEGLFSWRAKNAVASRLAKLNKFGHFADRVFVRESRNSYDLLREQLQMATRPLRIRGYFQDSQFATAQQIQRIRDSLKTRSTITSPRSNVKLPFTAVHLRLGDFSDLKQSLPLTYFSSALERLEELNSLEKNVYLFSDNLDLAKELFEGAGLRQLDRLQPIHTSTPREMICMFGLANSAVISNSTLAWWAAKLSTSIEKVVCPVNWQKRPLPFHILDQDWLKVDLQEAPGK
jgi:hypothetical protein